MFFVVHFHSPEHVESCIISCIINLIVLGEGRSAKVPFHSNIVSTVVYVLCSLGPY